MEDIESLIKGKTCEKELRSKLLRRTGLLPEGVTKSGRYSMVVIPSTGGAVISFHVRPDFRRCVIEASFHSPIDPKVEMEIVMLDLYTSVDWDEVHESSLYFCGLAEDKGEEV